MRRAIAIGALAAAALTLGACSLNSKPAASPHHGIAFTGGTGSAYSGSTGNTGTSLQSWAEAVKPTWGAITSDLNGISADANNLDVTAMQADCTSLVTDAQTAESAGPIPNSSMEQTWQAIVSGLQTAGNDCAQGASQGDAGLIQAATSELDKVNGEIATLTAQLKLS